MRRGRLIAYGVVTAIGAATVLSGCAAPTAESAWSAEAGERFVREVRYQATPTGIDDPSLLAIGDYVCRELLAWDELGDLEALTTRAVAEGLDPYTARTLVDLAPARLCPEAEAHLRALRAAAGVEEPHDAARHATVEESVANAVAALDSVLAERGSLESAEVTPTPEDGGTASILESGNEVGSFEVRVGVRIRVAFEDDGFTVTGLSVILPSERLVYDSRSGEQAWHD